MDTQKESVRPLKALIKDRCSVYSHLSFQRFLLVFFLVTGLLFFISGTVNIFISIIQTIYIDELTNEIAKEAELENYKEIVHRVCVTVIQPKELWSAFKSLLLGLSLLALSRYCQKVLNRNKYILKLETEIKKLEL